MCLGMMAVPNACCVGIRALHSWHSWNTFPKEPKTKPGVPGLLFAAENRWTVKPQVPEKFSSKTVELVHHKLMFKFSFPPCLVFQNWSHFPSARAVFPLEFQLLSEVGWSYLGTAGFPWGGTDRQTDRQPKGQLRPLAATPVSTLSLSSLGKKHLSPISELGTTSALQERKMGAKCGMRLGRTTWQNSLNLEKFINFFLSTVT